jgi:hypothetical protein
MGFAPFGLGFDAVGGLVVGVLAGIWALIFLVGSIVAVIKVLRLGRGSKVVTSG